MPAQRGLRAGRRLPKPQETSHPTRIGIKGRVTSSESIQAPPKLGGVRVGKPVPGRPGRMHVELRQAPSR